MISEEELLGFARSNDLELEAKKIQNILDNFHRIEQAAQVVNSVELGPEDELAPEWRP